MAIIKRTPRPGELVRGATAGDLAAFGPDGELVDSGLATEDVPEWPEGGNEGDVMTKGASGPEWAPQAAPKIYSHSVRLREVMSLIFPTIGTISSPIMTEFEIYNTSPDEFTYATLVDYLSTHFDNNHGFLAVTAGFAISVGDPAVLHQIVNVANTDWYYDSATQRITNGGLTWMAIAKTAGTISDIIASYPYYYSTGCTVSDKVVAV